MLSANQKNDNRGTKIFRRSTMKEYLLNVPVPRSFSYVKRNIPEVTVEQR